MKQILSKTLEILKVNIKNSVLNLIEYLIYIIFLFFLSSYLVLLLSEKPISDDFLIFYKFKEWGYYQFIVNHYYYWEGSYSLPIIQSPLIYFTERFSASVYYNLLVTVLFILGIYVNIKVYLKNDNRGVALIVILMYYLSSYFINYKHLKQVFLWNTGNMGYLLPFVFLFFGLYFINSQKKTFKIVGVLGLILFAGFRISYNLELMIIASVFMIGINMKKITWDILKTPVLHLILIVFLCSIFYYIAPGNEFRFLNTTSTFLEGQGVKEKIIALGQVDNLYKLLSSLENLWLTLHFKNGIYPYAVMIIVAFYMHVRGINIKFNFWLTLVAYLLMLLGHGILMFLIYGGSGPSRVLLFLILMRNYLIILSFRSLLSRTDGVYIVRNIIVFCIAFLVLKSAIYTAKRAFQENVSYRKFHDTRLMEIYQQSESDTLLLTPSPDWKFYYHDDNSWSWDRSCNGKAVRYK
jgi:hypothetical protein